MHVSRGIDPLVEVPMGNRLIIDSIEINLIEAPFMDLAQMEGGFFSHQSSSVQVIGAFSKSM